MKIRSRIIGAVLAAVAVANGIYTVYFLEREERAARARLDRTIAETNRLIGSLLAGPLYRGDVESVQSDLDAFFVNPEIVLLKLTRRSDGMVMSQDRAPAVGDGERLVYRLEINRGAEELGVVEVVYSTASIYNRLRKSRDELIIVSMAALLGLAVVMYFFARALSRPIERLTEAARAMAVGQMDERFHPQGAQELRELGQSFLRMRDAIGTQMADLADKNQRLNAEIAQRRDAEGERDRLIAIVEATPDFISFADLDRNILYMNAGGRRLIGIGDREVSTLRIPDVHPAWASDIILNEGIPTALRTGNWSGETALLSADGNEIPVSQVILRHIGSDGRVDFISTLMRDISSRRQIEQVLRASEARLAEAQRLAHVGSWELDIVHNKLQWSDEIYRIFEIDPDQFQASYEAFLKAVHPDDRDLVNRAYTSSVAKREPYDIVHRLLMPDGRVKFVREVCQTDYDDAGNPIRSVGTVQDITEAKRAEEQLREYQEHLERLVEERTRQLSVSNKELESFAYSVSHDLRAPLRAIDGFSRILLEDHSKQLAPEARSYLERVCGATKRVAQLIDDLLEFSRVARSELQIEHVDISGLAAEVVEQLRTAESERTVQISVNPGLVCRGDPRLLRLVLENLIGNAWKYTRRTAKPRIEIDVAQIDGETVYSVRDNGVGFDMAYAEKLFEPFQRLHSREEFEGTGVGLAIVARILHRHGGRIWAESRPGQGATFFFTVGAAVPLRIVRSATG